MNGNSDNNILLRAMEPEDIDAIYRWENNPSVWSDSSAHQPFSRQALSQFIEKNSGADIYSCRQLRLMAEWEEIMRTENGKRDCKNVFCRHNTVGCIDLFDFDPHHRRAGVGIIVDNQYRRQGIGLQMLYALENFSHQHLLIHQLHCTIAANNNASIALFEKAGYLRCGTLSQWVFDNRRWIDAYIYQKIIA